MGLYDYIDFSFIHKEGILLKIFQTEATPLADMLKYYSPKRFVFFLPFNPQHTSFAKSYVSQYPKSFAFHPPGCDIGCVLRCICQDPTHTEVVPVWWLCKFSLCSHSSRKSKELSAHSPVPPLYVLEEPEENFPPWLKSAC